MTCTEVKSSKYQSRKSPPFHASDCKGTRKKGKDGDYISKVDKKGVYKWVKVSGKISGKISGKVSGKAGTQKGKSYDTLDNGLRPYRVIVDGTNVSIYKGTRKEDYTYDYDKLIRSVKVKKVYLGGSKSGLGNSILLHLSGNKYMYIGHEIYEFQMEDSVESYFSLIGNSDVPYPILLGTEYAYFMLDRCYVARTEFSPSMTKKDWEDAYQRYYGYTNPMTSEVLGFKEKHDGLKTKCKKMKGFHIVAKRG
jgi:hypothetical protein